MRRGAVSVAVEPLPTGRNSCVLGDEEHAAGRALHRALVHQQDVERGQDDAGGRDDRGHRLGAGNEPISTRNSLTNCRCPGSASEARPAMRKTPASTGRLRRHAAVVADQPRAAAGDEQADDEEQQAGREAVVDHVEHRAGGRLGGEREDAQRDEAEVRDRGVGHQPLHVALAHRQQRGVEDADDRQHQHAAARSSARRPGTAAGSSAGSRTCRPCPGRRPAAPRRRSGASAPASGSQVWNGNSGALIANAMKKPRNSQLLRARVDVQLARARRRRRCPRPAGCCSPRTAR